MPAKMIKAGGAPTPKAAVKPAAEAPAMTEDAAVANLRSGNCNVTYEKSLTKNLGNYESAKITVAVTLPVNPSPEEIKVIKKTLEVADAIVTEELEVQVKELVEAK